MRGGEEGIVEAELEEKGAPEKKKNWGGEEISVRQHTRGRGSIEDKEEGRHVMLAKKEGSNIADTQIQSMWRVQIVANRRAIRDPRLRTINHVLLMIATDFHANDDSFIPTSECLLPLFTIRCCYCRISTQSRVLTLCAAWMESVSMAGMVAMRTVTLPLLLVCVAFHQQQNSCLSC